jgi:hypothetical protein
MAVLDENFKIVLTMLLFMFTDGMPSGNMIILIKERPRFSRRGGEGDGFHYLAVPRHYASH